jgi:hypothetical protein
MSLNFLPHLGAAAVSVGVAFMTLASGRLASVVGPVLVGVGLAVAVRWRSTPSVKSGDAYVLDRRNERDRTDNAA